MALPQWLVVKASAGSGKTYALVFHYLRLALSVGSHESYYRNILAITFTNAAAAEMKTRVIKTLHQITVARSSDEVPVFSALCEALKIDEDTLRERARSTFTHMLHNYGQISIGTIDGFNHRLLRAFAYDLQLQHDFKVEIDNTRFKREMIESLYARVGKEDLLTHYVLRYVLQNVEEEKSWDVQKPLTEMAELIFKEDTLQHLDTLSGLTLQDFQRSEKGLREIIRSLPAKLITAVEPAIQIMNQEGLEISDFSGGSQGGLGKYLLNLHTGFVQSPSATAEKAVNSGKVMSSKPSAHVKEVLTAQGHVFIECFNKALALLQGPEGLAYQTAQLVLKNIYALGLIHEFNNIADELRKENNVVFVNDFQKILSNIITDNPAPFIYERLGEKYNHILFDEFQDTSEMQWHNLLPLLENALSKNQFNLIVGDGKQAIYRWRSGKAGQFTMLPALGPSHQVIQSLFSEAYREEILAHNYRSAQTIVDFNNGFYQYLVEKKPNTSVVYSDHSQSSVREETGLVSVRILDKEEGRPMMYDHIRACVSECLKAGFNSSDIAILTRHGFKDTMPIAEALAQDGVQVLTQESMRLSESPKVMVIVHMLNHYHAPHVAIHAIEIIKVLALLFPEKINMSDVWRFNKNIEIPLETFLTQQFELPLGSLGLQSSLYETSENIIRSLHLEMDDPLEFFLDHVRSLEQKKGISLKGLIDWWEEKKEKLFVKSTQQKEAVRICTVHKSKGLQYPVVIVPFQSSRNHTNQMWIAPHLEGIPLRAALVSFKVTKEEEISLPEFTEESKLIELDELNLSYVATTRAESRLYIVAEHKSKVAAELHGYCSSQSSFVEAEKNIFIAGKEEDRQHPTPALPSIKKPTSPQAKGIRALLQQMTQQQPTLATSLNLYRSARLGSELHETLSCFQHKADQAAVKLIVEKKWPLMGSLLQKGLIEQVLEIFSSPLYENWFAPEHSAKTECEIITPDGIVYRPDRVVFCEEHIEVVDFKTGKAMASHQDQVKSYMKVISLIHSMPVKGFVAYIPGLERIEVLPDP